LKLHVFNGVRLPSEDGFETFKIVDAASIASESTEAEHCKVREQLSGVCTTEIATFDGTLSARVMKASLPAEIISRLSGSPLHRIGPSQLLNPEIST
jgi:hypothetical protein